MKRFLYVSLGLIMSIGITITQCWAAVPEIMIKNNLKWGIAKRDETGVKVINICTYDMSDAQCQVGKVTKDGKPAKLSRVVINPCYGEPLTCLHQPNSTLLFMIAPGETKKVPAPNKKVFLRAYYDDGATVVEYVADRKDHLEFPNDFSLK